MSVAPHPEETLQDYVDGRLAGQAAEDVRAHLETCAGCRAVRDELLIARHAAVTLRHEDIAMPADLLAAVQRRLDAEGTGAAAAGGPAGAIGSADATREAGTSGAGSGVPVEPTRMPSSAPGAGRAATGRRWWVVASAAAALAAYLVLGNPTAPLDLPTQAARDLGDIGSLTLPFAIASSDAAAIERYFAESAGPRVRVIDMAMMDITLEGGVRHTIDGRRSAVYSYRTPSGDRLMCQMYEGRLADLPPPADVREQNGFRFQIYTRDAVTLVFWQEGDLVCVLASELPASEVLGLAVAKAMAPV